MSGHHLIITHLLAAVATLFATASAMAEDAPRSYIASPEIYRVIAESDNTKVLLVAWKPGQRDNWHSHPATAVYFLTDCEARVHTPDGKYMDGHRTAGASLTQAPISSHSFENRGSSECKAIIVDKGS